MLKLVNAWNSLERCTTSKRQIWALNRSMFKAEVDIDGREIARSYLERIDIQLILKVCLSPSLYSGRWVYSCLVLVLGNSQNRYDRRCRDISAQTWWKCGRSRWGAEIDRIERESSGNLPLDSLHAARQVVVLFLEKTIPISDTLT